MKKKILNITILFLVIMIVSVAGVYAARTIQSSVVTYNNGTSKLKSTNVQGAIDELYAKCVTGNATFSFVKYLQALEPSSTVVTDDGTAGHNMRYIGAEPNNWVLFNGELWRIIGIFGTDSHGQSDRLVKIQHTSDFGKIIWGEPYINDWTKSPIKTYLNEGEYYTKTLKSDAKQMIQKVNWRIGGAPFVQDDLVAKKFYENERGSTGSKVNPTLIQWSGDVALLYPSDYLFSTNGGLMHSREECITTPSRNEDVSVANVLWRTDGNNAGECAKGSWIYHQLVKSGQSVWTITPSASSSNATYALTPAAYGSFSHANVDDSYRYVSPAVYLKSSILCTNCSSGSVGTESNPFKIKLG